MGGALGKWLTDGILIIILRKEKKMMPYPTINMLHSLASNIP